MTTKKTMQTMVKTPKAFYIKGQTSKKLVEIFTHNLDYRNFKLMRVPKWGGFNMTVATMSGDINLTTMVNSLTHIAYELEKHRKHPLEDSYVIRQGRTVIATCSTGCVKGKMAWEFDTRFMSFITRE